MKKIRIALGAVLPAVLVLIAVIFAMILRLEDFTGTAEDLGEGLARVFGILFALIALLAGLPLMVGLLVTEICLFAVKKPMGTAIATLALLCLFLPVLVAVLVFSGTLIVPHFAAFSAVLAAAAAVYLASFALSCVYVHLCRKQRKESMQEESAQA